MSRQNTMQTSQSYIARFLHFISKMTRWWQFCCICYVIQYISLSCDCWPGNWKIICEIGSKAILSCSSIAPPTLILRRAACLHLTSSCRHIQATTVVLDIFNPDYMQSKRSHTVKFKCKKSLYSSNWSWHGKVDSNISAEIILRCNCTMHKKIELGSTCDRMWQLEHFFLWHFCGMTISSFLWTKLSNHFGHLNSTDWYEKQNLRHEIIGLCAYYFNCICHILYFLAQRDTEKTSLERLDWMIKLDICSLLERLQRKINCRNKLITKDNENNSCNLFANSYLYQVCGLRNGNIGTPVFHSRLQKLTAREMQTIVGSWEGNIGISLNQTKKRQKTIRVCSDMIWIWWN